MNFFKTRPQRPYLKLCVLCHGKGQMGYFNKNQMKVYGPCDKCSEGTVPYSLGVTLKCFCQHRSSSYNFIFADESKHYAGAVPSEHLKALKAYQKELGDSGRALMLLCDCGAVYLCKDAAGLRRKIHGDDAVNEQDKEYNKHLANTLLENGVYKTLDKSPAAPDGTSAGFESNSDSEEVPQAAITTEIKRRVAAPVITTTPTTVIPRPRSAARSASMGHAASQVSMQPQQPAHSSETHAPSVPVPAVPAIQAPLEPPPPASSTVSPFTYVASNPSFNDTPTSRTPLRPRSAATSFLAPVSINPISRTQSTKAPSPPTALPQSPSGGIGRYNSAQLAAARSLERGLSNKVSSGSGRQVGAKDGPDASVPGHQSPAPAQ